jgi:hypothetical protein
VRLTPDGHALKHGYLINLGNSFVNRFERTGEFVNIDKVISVGNAAVQLIPHGHMDRAFALHNLMHRFNYTGELVDVDKAISALDDVVRIIPDGHAFMPMCLHAYGSALVRHFKCTEDLIVLEKAISTHHDAVHLTPEGHIVQVSPSKRSREILASSLQAHRKQP